MEKYFYLTLIFVFFSCDIIPIIKNTDEFIITSHTSKDTYYLKYNNGKNVMKIKTDSVYQIGDTLHLTLKQL